MPIQVNDEMANVLVAQILYLANQDEASVEFPLSTGTAAWPEDSEKDITIYINSPGQRNAETSLEELFEAGLRFRWVGLCRHGYLRCHAVRPLCGSCTQHTHTEAQLAARSLASQATCPPSATAWPPRWGPSCSEQVAPFRLCSVEHPHLCSTFRCM